MSDAIKLAIDTLQNTIDCLMRENEKNDGPICDTIWYDDHTTLFDYINCELAALRAQLNIGNPITAQPDHSELVKRLRNFDFGSSDVDQWIEIMDEAADALEGKAIKAAAQDGLSIGVATKTKTHGPTSYNPVAAQIDEGFGDACYEQAA